jgi:hypothetical protein
MGLVVFRRCGLWEASEQGHGGGNVLARLGEVWETVVVLDNPPVHVASPDACAPAVRATSDFTLELRALLL